MDIESRLRGKAILALEELVQECRYCQPRRSFAVRFALAYLWSLAPGDREPFVEYWRAIEGDNELTRMRNADYALAAICRQLGVKRNEALSWRLWREAQARHRSEPSGN